MAVEQVTGSVRPENTFSYLTEIFILDVQSRFPREVDFPKKHNKVDLKKKFSLTHKAYFPKNHT